MGEEYRNQKQQANLSEEDCQEQVENRRDALQLENDKQKATWVKIEGENVEGYVSDSNLQCQSLRKVSTSDIYLLV